MQSSHYADLQEQLFRTVVLEGGKKRLFLTRVRDKESGYIHGYGIVIQTGEGNGLSFHEEF